MTAQALLNMLEDSTATLQTFDLMVGVYQRLRVITSSVSRCFSCHDDQHVSQYACHVRLHEPYGSVWVIQLVLTGCLIGRSLMSVITLKTTIPSTELL